MKTIYYKDDSLQKGAISVIVKFIMSLGIRGSFIHS